MSHMTHSKKMLLVDPERRQENNAMQDASQSPIDVEMQEILGSHLSEDVKAKLYQNIISKYLIGSKKTTSWGVPDSKNDEIEEELLESVPPHQRYKAKRIVRVIRNTPEAEWNSRGEFVYRQRTIPQSHIIELVNDILKTTSTGDPPVGWQEFAQALRSSQVPKELVLNKQRWSYIQKTDETIDKPAKKASSKKSKEKGSEQIPEITDTVRKKRKTRTRHQWTNWED